MSPKISESPAASRNRSMPNDTPLRVWMAQKVIEGRHGSAGTSRAARGGRGGPARGPPSFSVPPRPGLLLRDCGNRVDDGVDDAPAPLLRPHHVDRADDLPGRV